MDGGGVRAPPPSHLFVRTTFLLALATWWGIWIAAHFCSPWPLPCCHKQQALKATPGFVIHKGVTPR